MQLFAFQPRRRLPLGEWATDRAPFFCMPDFPILHGPDRPDLLRHEILADIFEATAARVPHKTALIFGERHLTYAELNDAADRVAHRLIEAGVGAGDMVGLWHPRGIELLVL